MVYHISKVSLKLSSSSKLPHCRTTEELKAMQEKYGLEILTTIWPWLHTVKQIGLIKWIKICLCILFFFNNHTPHSNRLTTEYNHCNRKCTESQLCRFISKDKQNIARTRANMLTPITQWHRAAKNIMSRTPVLLYVLELLVISCRWLSLVVNGYGWLSMVADGCRWLQRWIFLPKTNISAHTLKEALHKIAAMQ